MKPTIGRPGRAIRSQWLLLLVCSVTGWNVPLAGAVASATPAAVDLGSLEFEQLAGIRVTSVSRQEGTVLQSPAAVFVISSEMIARSGATAIPELFRLVPGMGVARLDNNKWIVGARGFNDRFFGKQLVQLDGRTLYNPILSGVYWDTVNYPLEDLERIEVIRGPGASIWGANAVNGVINLESKSARDTQGGLVSLAGGTDGHGIATLRQGGRIGENFFYRIYGRGFDEGKQFSAANDPNDEWRLASGGLRLDWEPTANRSLMLSAGYQRSTAGRRDFRPRTAAPYFTDNTETDAASETHLLLRWAEQTEPGSSWTLQLYADQSYRVGDQGFVNLGWDTYDLDFHRQLTLGSHQKLVFGAGYRRQDISLRPSRPDDGFAVAYTMAHRHLQLFSAFVQDEIRLVEHRLSLILGTKLEHNDYTGIEIQPTVRAVWTPSPRQTVWTGVSRAVRTPNAVEIYGLTKLLTAPGSPNFLEIRGSPDLASEILLAFDLGYRFQISDRLSADVAGFLYNYDRLLGSRPGALESMPPVSVTPLNRTNPLSAETGGLEVAVTWQVADMWHLRAGASFLQMNLHRAPGLTAAAEAAEHQSPEEQAYLQSSWHLTRETELDLTGRFVSGLHGFNPGGTPGFSDSVAGYISLDARLAWRPDPHLELALVGQNLLDPQHPEFGTSAIVRTPLVEIQRRVYGKITWRF